MGVCQHPRAPSPVFHKGLFSAQFSFLFTLMPCSISSDCSIFADDTSVYNTGSKPPSICSMLSKDLTYAADWAAEWGMLFKINAEKSEHLAISTRKSDITSPHVTMNGTQIPQVTSHKHLGVNFNNTLSWQHVDKVYTSCARRIGMIRRLRRKLHPVVLKRIYLGAVLPKLEYACPVWCGGPTQKLIKGEVRRKMNFTYVLGFVVLRDVVKDFPVNSSSFARKTTGGIEHEVTRGHDAA